MRLRLLWLPLTVFVMLSLPAPLSAEPEPVKDGLRAAVAREVVATQVRDFVTPIVLEQLNAELERAVVFVAAVTPRPAPAVVTREAAPPASGGGGHTDAWWQGVAMCEQGGRNDPYYGYFSFMDGSQGGRPWADQVAAGNDLLARAGREVGPWAAACVAAGYRAAPW